MDDRRLFTSAQHRELFVSAGGRCQSCGIDLPDNWEAHHKIAYSDGGLTEQDNGEALCPKCHRERHDKRFIPFAKDYSWQEDSISYFMSSLQHFYSEERGQFERAYVNEVSPSGGKSIFSMKLAARMIEANLIDKVIWCVPRENIKDGFADDARFVRIAADKRLLNSQFIRVDTDLSSTYRGQLRNYHGAIITYHALKSTYEYIGLLAEKYRILLFLDESHHGTIGDVDDAMNVWGREMERLRELVNAIVCMTGTPLRSDSKRTPFVRYKPVTSSDGRSGYEVEPDFSFSYQKAVAAGIARKLICRSQDSKINYVVDARNIEQSVTQIPAIHLSRVKNTAFCFTRGIVDEMLKIAHDECGRMRRTGDPDAAVLVIGRRDQLEGDSSLSNIAKRIDDLFKEECITVESADGPKAREMIRDFKRGNGKWIVAKEMISEGTNIPRLRVVVILRDIGNQTFYEQLVHRITRNDADDRPQDAVIIQLQLPNLHNWGKDLEQKALIGWEKQRRPEATNVDVNQPQAQPYIAGISAELESETVIMEGEDFTDVDPKSRILVERIGEETRTSRWQINKILREASKETSDVADETVRTVEEQCNRMLKLGTNKCRAAAINFGGGDAFARIFAECKKLAGINCKLGHLIKDHHNPLGAAQAFQEAATKKYEQSRLMKKPPVGSSGQDAMI